MEISDFNTDNDGNYVSIELLSENEDEDDSDDVTLDTTIPFCPPKDLLSGKSRRESATDSDSAPLQTEAEDRYAMTSTPHHRFLSDHQYLVGGSMHHIVPVEAADEQMSMHVPHSSERFSVSYDMDIRTQDLFNKESHSNGECLGRSHSEDPRGYPSNNEEELNNNIATDAAGDYVQCKIEIGDTIVQDDVSHLECGSHEEIGLWEYAKTQSSDEDEDDKRIVKTLLDGMPRLSMEESEEVRPFEDDHSYTTLTDRSTQPTEHRGTPTCCAASGHIGNTEVSELVALSKKLAKERDVTSTDAKQIAQQIEQAVKTFRKRQQERSIVSETESRTVSDETHSNADVTKRTQNDSHLPSSAETSVGTLNENGHDDSDRLATATNLDQLLSLGDCFTKQCEQWLEKKSNDNEKLRSGTTEITQLLNVLDTLKRKLVRVSSSPGTDSPGERDRPTDRVESAVQTVDRSASPTCYAEQQKQRALNEVCRKAMLASASSDSSSSLSASNASSGTANSDSAEGKSIMSDFMRRRRMRKSAKDKRQAKVHLASDETAAAPESDGAGGQRRRKQIYTDSSESESDHREDRRPMASSKDQGRQGNRTEGDDNLLDGVLSGVDDIMLDVHDILPAAEGVVQDFLEKEDVQSRKQEGKGKPNSSAAASVTKSVTEMTESELEEYHDAQNEKEIERLCNISYLSVGRSAPAVPVTAAAAAAVGNSNAVRSKEKKKKAQNTMEDFLNDKAHRRSSPLQPLSGGTSDNSDHSGSDKEAVETEEQFLQKCNENMKYELLNQLSSSSSSSRASSDDDGRQERSSGSEGERKEKGDDDEDDDDDGSLDSMHNFLKRLEAKGSVRRVNKSRPSKTTQGVVEQSSSRAENGTESGPDTPEARGEQSNGVPGDQKTPLADACIVGRDAAEEEARPKVGAAEKADKLKVADPKDRALFRRDVLDGSDGDGGEAVRSITNSQPKASKAPRQKRYDKSFGKTTSLLSSDADTDGEKSSADSDVELLNDSGNSRKRRRIPSISQEPFDYNDPLLSNRRTVAKEKKQDSMATTNGAGARANQSPSTAQSPSVKATGPSESPVTGTSPDVGEPSSSSASTSTSTTATTTTTATSAKQSKSSAREQDQDCISLSSESDADTEVVAGDLDEAGTRKTPPEKQRKIRPMLSNDELAEETKKAQKEEEGRVARLKKKNEMLKKFLQNGRSSREGAVESELVLDYSPAQEEAICVHPDIVKLLKPHQVEGIKFMYDNTYGSVDALAKHPGSGCILAHCMGLGKTLQMIALLHTVMRYPQLLTRRVLVICPKSTVMNWKEEIIRWQGTIRTGHQMRVYCFADVCTQADKLSVLKKWFSSAAPNCGVMLIGYEAFRALINYERRKRPVALPRSSKLDRIKEYLLNPGADLVICDEGHQIKNKRSAISEAVSKIKTKRRIMLTGTPIQNNLKEYYCMVNFIKPSFLGSDKEFSNLYANPIKNGQCKDSDQRAIKIMKQRSYVLHNKLSKFVQRKEAAVLKEFLPEKYEYVLFVPLTPVQERMYEVFLQMNDYTSSSDMPGGGGGEPGRNKKFKLIADYTSLRKIWTHPKVLEKAWESAIMEKNRKDAARKTATPDSDDDSPDDKNDIASGQLSVTNDWWRRYLDVPDLESLFPSNKLWVMFEILKQCNDRGEKCLIFSAFVAVLNVVEHFMAKIHNQASDPEQSEAYAYSAFKGPWEPRKDYYRLDGKTPKSDRHRMITSFNDPRNTRTKCFLISAKAGGQGINLTGANRVIILDTSWNPSNDQQNIFRIFRLGQKRKCYVYRLLAMGTMEEKVYSRSVTKQALSFRVVDEQQIDRHYSYGELAELYTLSKVSEMRRETPILPADDVLCLLLRLYPNKIFKYHEHDSLLENKPEQDLSEEDKKEAWAAYEREIQTNENRSLMSAAWSSMSAQAALFNQPGAAPYGRMLEYYNNLCFSGMAGPSALGATSGGEMYRTDFSYNRALYNAYASAQQPQYSMLSDSPYSALLSKSPYAGYPLSAVGGGLDYGSPTMLNGQPGGLGGTGGKPYDPTAALANFFNLYSSPKPSALAPGAGNGGAGSISGSNSNSTGGGGGATPNPGGTFPSSSSPLAAVGAPPPPPYNGMHSPSAYNFMKQMADFGVLNSPTGLTITNVSSLAPHHKSSAGGSVVGQSNNGTASGGVGGGVGQATNPTTLSMLNEQAKLAAAAAAAAAAASAPPPSSLFASPGVSSSPFSPRSAPLLAPTIETQMRNFMGLSSTSKTTPQPPKIASPKTTTGTPMAPPSPHNSSGNTTRMNATSSAGSSSSSGSSGNSAGTTVAAPRNSPPIITSVMSMAPHLTMDSSYRRTPDALEDGAGKKNVDRSKTGPGRNRTPTPTVNRSCHSPTIIPSDDEEEATNAIVGKKAPGPPPPPPPTSRPVSNGVTGTKEPVDAVRTTTTATATASGSVGTGNPRGTPASKSSSASTKDVLKGAKSLTNLSQTKPPPTPSPLAGAVKVPTVSPMASQTPPPIIRSPDIRPFQTVARSNSSLPFTASFGTGQQQQQQQSQDKGVTKVKRPSAPLASKLISSAATAASAAASAATVTRNIQQQQTPPSHRPLAVLPARNAVPSTSTSTQPQKALPTPKPTAVPVVAGTGQLVKPSSDPRSILTGQTPKLPSKGAIAVTSASSSKPPLTASAIVSRQTGASPVGNVSKTMPPQQQKSTPDTGSVKPSGTGFKPVSAAGGTNSAVNSPALMMPKTTIVVNPVAASARLAATKQSANDSRPTTQLQGGAGIDALKVHKKSIPVGAPKPTALQASVNQGSRSSPVGVRPIGGASAAQKPSIPVPAKVSASSSSPSVAATTSTTALNRVSAASLASSTKTVGPALSSVKSNPIRMPTAVAAAASPSVVSRIIKAAMPAKSLPSNGGTSSATTATRTVTTPATPSLAGHRYPTHLTVGTTTMTVIPSSNLAPKPQTNATINSSTASPKPATLSYSIKNGSSGGGVVITKATASPTIRQILPQPGAPHVVVKGPTGTSTVPTVAALSRGSLSTAIKLPGGTPVARQVVSSGLGARTGSASTAANSGPIGAPIAGAATNNVFIRKRKPDHPGTTLLTVEGLKAAKQNSGADNTPPKRSKVDESPASSTTFAGVGRVGTAGITLTPRGAGGAKDRVEIVEIE